MPWWWKRLRSSSPTTEYEMVGRLIQQPPTTPDVSFMTTPGRPAGRVGRVGLLDMRWGWT